MKRRIMSSLILLPVLGAIIYSSLTTALVMLCVSIIAMKEYDDAFKNAGYKLMLPVMYAAVLYFTGISYFYKVTGLYDIGIIAAVILIISFLVIKNTKYNVSDAGITLFGIIYVAMLLSYVINMRVLDDGAWFVWLIFIGSWATDTFAYFTGSFIGKRKLIPSISPNKTIEGAIGGIFGAVLISILYGMLINSQIDMPIKLYHYAIMGLICGVVSQIGDLTASSIKRYCNKKDFGSLIPGHGGILDRFDSILPVAPIIYYYVVILTEQIKLY